MEEHIESVGADSEGIVKLNVRVMMCAFLFVVAALCAVAAAAVRWEPVGLPLARLLAGRWGDAACDAVCAASPERPSRGRFFLTWNR
jgi:hypothetical protein